MGIIGQADWAGGIFRAPGGPDGTVYDAINAIVTDDRDLLKRGGGALKSNADTGAVTALWDGYIDANPRTLWVSKPAHTVHILDPANDATPLQLQVGVVFEPYRPVESGGILMYAGSSVYGGATPHVAYSTGTITVTKGSKIVTGAGTTFTGNVKVGDILQSLGAVPNVNGVVASVDSNTQVTLRHPWAGATAAGTTYTFGAVGGFLPFGTVSGFAAAVNQRLAIGFQNTVYFSGLGNPTSWDATDMWEIPHGSTIVGMDSLRDSLLVFTTSGVFAISNMDFDLTDDAGNVQQSLAQVSKDVLLWSNLGICGWEGQLLVPALDDVYVMGVDGPQSVISEGIRPLYRSYVKAGYQPGVAAVDHGHYLLPITDGNGAVYDVLVCRLDLRDSRGNTRPAWTRWSGYAAASAYAQRVPGSPGGSPKLLGATGNRISDLTDAFTPAAVNKRDADASTFNLDVTTRDFDTGGGNRNTVMAAKLRYELVDAASDNPTIAASYSEGPEGSAFTALTGSAPENDGTDPFTWRPVPPIRTRRLRLRLLSSGPSANLKIRVLELLVRSSSRL